MSSSTLQKTFSTPTKAAESPASDSPGNWKHPRLQEIIRRQNASTFSDKNVKKIAWNVAAISAATAFVAILHRYFPVAPDGGFANFIGWLHKIFVLVPLFNIGVALLPLARPKDDLSDIPLTPGQRKLLGLGPSSAPPTPGSVYSTPPRYSRTPSLSGSTGKRSFSGLDSPSAYRSPTEGNSGGFSGKDSTWSPSGSHLIQKAMNGARRSSIGSMGSPSPFAKSFGASTNFGASTSFGASTNFGASTSIFGGAPPDSPSPSPINGKRSSVSLNNKWLYERGRRSSGNAWAS